MSKRGSEEWKEKIRRGCSYRKLGVPDFKLRLVARESGCIEYVGYKNSRGYGEFIFYGVRMRTHRLAWELSEGRIPAGIDVLHRCDNPACCNVDHLFLGTAADNVRDATEKGKYRGINRSSTNGTAKLDESKVLRIFDLYRKGLNQREISEIFSIRPSQISVILSRKRWKHVLIEAFK